MATVTSALAGLIEQMTGLQQVQANVTDTVNHLLEQNVVLRENAQVRT